LPFFRHNETLQIFVCRFEIAENDYHKVEYSFQKVELLLDKLAVIHKDKGTLEEFDLTTLHNVVYLRSNAVLYQIEEFVRERPGSLSLDRHRDLTNLFVKYESAEQLKKWDLSIFSNYQLSSSLQESRVFENYFKRIRQAHGVNK
jgi:hypothetical protein